MYNDSETSTCFGSKPDKSVNVTVGVLLNLDEASEYYKTMSIFINGTRKHDPIKLKLADGKYLYPHIMFKGCAVNVNFGNKWWTPPPFVGRGLADAAKSDVTFSPIKKLDGEPEVIFPIGFGKEVNSWVEDFVKNNPTYIPLTNKAFERWNKISGSPSVTKGTEGQIGYAGRKIGTMNRPRNYIYALSPQDVLHYMRRKEDYFYKDFEIIEQ